MTTWSVNLFKRRAAANWNIRVFKISLATSGTNLHIQPLQKRFDQRTEYGQGRVSDFIKDIIIGGFILPIVLVQRHYAAKKQPPFWFTDLGLHTVSTKLTQFDL